MFCIYLRISSHKSSRSPGPSWTYVPLSGDSGWVHDGPEVWMVISMDCYAEGLNGFQFYFVSKGNPKSTSSTYYMISIRILLYLEPGQDKNDLWHSQPLTRSPSQTCMLAKRRCHSANIFMNEAVILFEIQIHV